MKSSKKWLLYQYPSRLFFFSSVLGASISLIFLVSVVVILGQESLFFLLNTSIKSYLSFSWFPEDGDFGILPMLVGSLLLMFLSLLFALPFSIVLTLVVFLFPSKIQLIIKEGLETISAIPSVVWGLWGMTSVVPLIATWKAPGVSLLASVLLVSFLIIPYNVVILLNMFMESYKKHSSTGFSLGLTKIDILFKIVLPQNKHTYWGVGIMQSLRVLGETIIVLMVCGNIPQIPQSIFSPIRTITTNIALEMAYAMDEHRSSLFFMGMLLTFMISCLMFVQRIFGGRESV